MTIPALWFVPLNDPMKLLVYSMLFGVIHLFLGLGLKGYMLLKDGKVVDFICDVVLWYLLLLGLILMLLPTELFGSIAQMNIVFPPVLNSLAKGMAIVGALGILVMSARDKKNPILRLALGAYDLYNITGWVSDVLSYSRLLALGLATGVIAGVQDAGLSVPNDIAVAGCDGNPLAWSGSVPLTTCAPPGYEIGRRGVQFLIDQIERRRALASGEAKPEDFADEDPCHQTMIRPFLLAHQSTVAKTTHQQSAEAALNLGTCL